MKTKTIVKILIGVLVVGSGIGYFTYQVMHKRGEKENRQGWWRLEREDDRIEAFLNSREQLLKESFPPMEDQSEDDYLRAFLDIRKSQYAEDLRRCKSQNEREVVRNFWRSYFMELCGHDPQDEYNHESETF